MDTLFNYYNKCYSYFGKKDSNYKNLKKTGSSTEVDKLAKIYGGLEFNF